MMAVIWPSIQLTNPSSLYYVNGTGVVQKVEDNYESVQIEFCLSDPVLDDILNVFDLVSSTPFMRALLHVIKILINGLWHSSLHLVWIYNADGEIIVVSCSLIWSSILL